MKKNISLTIIMLLNLLTATYAEESAFRTQFSEFYMASRFEAMAALVKQSKEILPSEVESIIKEAMEETKTFSERMQLLDLASTMATMHVEWNKGDDSLLKKVGELQKIEATKERKRVEEIEKWQKEEKVPGNFVMKTHGEEMEAKGLAPVLYPHWAHRLFFRCKVCHESIFKMKRGANELSHAKIDEGKLCGVCHNSKISFSAADEKQCHRCHIAGTDRAKPLHDLSRFKNDELKEVSSRIGGLWKPEKLPSQTYPLDRYRFINWIELDRLEAFKPLDFIEGETKSEGVRENSIYFEPTSSIMKGVIFSHKIHSTWVNCSLCHPEVFKPELGANKIAMKDMAEGKNCGLCHGRVAFTFSDCNRCHSHKGELPLLKDTLVHPAPPKQ